MNGARSALTHRRTVILPTVPYHPTMTSIHLICRAAMGLSAWVAPPRPPSPCFTWFIGVLLAAVCAGLWDVFTDRLMDVVSHGSTTAQFSAATVVYLAAKLRK